MLATSASDVHAPPPPSAPASNGATQELLPHVPALDGLRGIAVLMVVAYHTKGYAPDSWWAVPMQLGWSGVDLFFVLSGYLITSILLRTKGSAHYYSSFYARRFLRIFPLYYSFLFLFLVIDWRFRLFERMGLLFWTTGKPQTIWYWTYLYNFYVAATDSYQHIALAPTWTLSIEEQFYALWPFVVRRLSARGVVAACGALLILAPIARLVALTCGVPAHVVHHATPFRLDALAGGALLAALPAATKRRFGTSIACAVAAGGALAGIASVWLMTRTLEVTAAMQTVGYSALVVLYVAAVQGVTGERTLIGNLLSNRSLRDIGKYSYSIYLNHLLVSHVVGLHVIRRLGYSRTGLPYFLLAFAVTVGVSLALARLTWWCLESRFLALKRYVPYE